MRMAGTKTPSLVHLLKKLFWFFLVRIFVADEISIPIHFPYLFFQFLVKTITDALTEAFFSGYLFELLFISQLYSVF